MAKVPVTTTIGEYAGAIPGGYRGISESVPGDRAAAWRAAGQVGEQIGAAGQRLTRDIIADQEVENDFQATTAINEFSRRANERFVQYSELQGRAAVDGFGQYQTDVRALRDEVLGGVSNEVLRRRLAGRLESTAEGLISGGQRYSVSQNRVALREATEAGIQNAINAGVVGRNDPRVFAAALATSLEQVDNLGRQQGWDPAKLQQERTAQTGRFYSATIATIAETDPLAANRMFTQVRDQLDAASQIRIANMLEVPVRERQAQDIQRNVTTPMDDSPEGVRARAFRIENPAGDARGNPTSSASGPGQVTNGLWNAYAPRLGLRPEQRNERAAQEAIWDAVQLDARRAVGRPLTPGEQWGVWHLGQGGMQAFISAPRDADAFETYKAAAGASIAERAFATNPGTLRRGMTVGQVRDALDQKMGQGQPRQDNGAMLQAAMRQAGDDPKLQAAVMTEMSRYFSVLNATQASERANLDRRVNELQRGLQYDPSLTIPEGEIRRYHQPPQAEAIIDRLNTAAIAGEIGRGIQLATPEEIDTTRADLASGSGATSAALRLRRGTRMEGDTVLEEDRAGDVAARGDVLRVYDEQVARRNQQLRADPAQYVVAADPAVREAAAEAAANPRDAGAAERYAYATVAAQARLGVPEAERRVISKPQALAIVGDIMRSDPGDGTPQNPDGPAIRMRGLQQQWGRAYQQVFGDLVRDGKLPPEYQVLATIESPIGQADFARMIAAANKAGGMNRLADVLPREARTQIDNEVGTYAAPFVRTATASGQTGGVALADVVQTSIKNLATYYAIQGASPGDALQRATDRVLNDKYEFQGTMRVPRSVGLDRVMRAQATVMRDLTPERIADIDGNPALTPGDRRNTAWAGAQRGQWVPNEDDTGLILMTDLRDGGRTPARWSGTAGDPERPWINPGGRVEILYSRMPEPTIRGIGSGPRDVVGNMVDAESGVLMREAQPQQPGDIGPSRPSERAPARPVQPGERGAPRGRGRWEAPQ